MILLLDSPFSDQEYVFTWPFISEEKKSEFIGFIELLEIAFKQVLKTTLGCSGILDQIQPNDLNSVLVVCQSVNHSIKQVLTRNLQKLWNSDQKKLLKQLIAYCYHVSVTNPSSLNRYQAFSPQVYGETNYDFIAQLIDELNFKTGEETFLDLGSGIGQVVMQVAASVNCKECIGIEYADIPYQFSKLMDVNFRHLLNWYGIECSKYTLVKGNFLDKKFDELLNRTTVIFTNNFAFGPQTNHLLKVKFQNMPEGARILASSKFCAENFKINGRNLSEFGSMVQLKKIYPHDSIVQNVSWTVKNIPFYLHTIDRTMIEKFFENLKVSQSEKNSKRIDMIDSFDGDFETVDRSNSYKYMNSKNGYSNNLFHTPKRNGEISPTKLSSVISQIIGKQIKNVIENSCDKMAETYRLYELIENQKSEYLRQSIKFYSQIEVAKTKFFQFKQNTLSVLANILRLLRFLQKMNSLCHRFLRFESLSTLEECKSQFTNDETHLEDFILQVTGLIETLEAQNIDSKGPDICETDQETICKNKNPSSVTSRDILESSKMMSDPQHLASIIQFLSVYFSLSMRVIGRNGFSNENHSPVKLEKNPKSAMKRCLDEALSSFKFDSVESIKRRKIGRH